MGVQTDHSVEIIDPLGHLTAVSAVCSSHVMGPSSF